MYNCDIIFYTLLASYKNSTFFYLHSKNWFSGVFFLPRDQQHDRPSKTTNYEGLAYLGGYALAWAACLGNETIYNILLEKVWAYNDTFHCAMNSFLQCIHVQNINIITAILMYFKGADPDAEDGFGNTVLHMVVVTNQMVCYIHNLYDMFWR